MTEQFKEIITALAIKAKEAETADAALKFSQAACNAANALCAFEYLSSDTRMPKK